MIKQIEVWNHLDTKKIGYHGLIYLSLMYFTSLGNGNGVTEDINSGVDFGSDGSGVGNRSISLGNEGNYERKP